MESRDAGRREWRHAWGVPSRAEKWLCISYTPRAQFVPFSSGGRGQQGSSGEPMVIVRLQTVSVLMCFKGESASSGRSFCICSSVLSFIQPWGTVA